MEFKLRPLASSHPLNVKKKKKKISNSYNIRTHHDFP